jgi:hypothetical protein
MFDEERIDTARVSSGRLEQHHRAPNAILRDPFSSPHRSADTLTDFRIAELEIENLRLQRLVAELLIKNQQLRRSGS